MITNQKKGNSANRPILGKSIWNFNVVFGPHVHTNGKPGLFFFHPSFGHFYIFRIFIPAISLGQKTNIRCLCIIVVSTKSLPKVLHWAGHDQSTSLAVTWQAQLLLPRSTVSYFVDVRATCPCAMLYTCTSRLRLVRPKISNEIDDNEKANTRTQQYEVCRCSPRSRYPRLYPWPLKSAGA